MVMHNKKAQKEHHGALAHQSNTKGRGDDDAQHRSVTRRPFSYAMEKHNEQPNIVAIRLQLCDFALYTTLQCNVQSNTRGKKNKRTP
jgi:hypothetical protein